MLFEFYVLNESSDRNRNIEPYNIFNNWLVQEAVEKQVKKYIRAPSKYKRPYEYNEEYKDLVGFDAFVREIDSIIKWQEWSRCEYEILVGSLFMKDDDRLKKIDCYEQAKPNMVMIAHEVIRQYKEQLKNNGDEK